LKKIPKYCSWILFIVQIWIYISISIHGYSQQSSEYSYRISPFIRNIENSEYKGANQCWSISQAPDGNIFVANRLGLLEFNGSNWKLYPMESIHPLRSVLAADDGLIYYGHFEDFGFFERDKYGILNQISISDSLISNKDIVNENIWSIHKIGRKIYFRSFAKIYIYDGKTITILPHENNIYSLFERNNKPYVSILPDGLYFIDENNDLQKEPIPDFLDNKRIITTIPLDEEQELIITVFEGIFQKKADVYSPWECEANELLKNFQINKCAVINNNTIAIGTIGKGVIVINTEGKIINSLDKINGLQSNTVLALLTDKSNNLWVGLDKGIDYIELNSPFLYCFDRPGSLGAVYSAILYNGRFYVGTNQGLFYTDWSNQKFEKSIRFEKIEEAQGHVWELKIIGDKLICNYNLGILQIDGNKIKQIGSEGGGYTSTPHPTRDSIFYQGNYTGILQFNKGNDENWKAGNWINDSIIGVRFLQVDQFNNLWVGENFKDAWLFRLNANGNTIINSKKLGVESNFNSRLKIGVFSFENRVIFSNNNMYFTYDYTTESIKPYKWLNDNLGEYKTANYMYRTSEYEYWFAKRDKFGRFYYNGESLVLTKEIKSSSLKGSAVDDRQNIWKINENRYVIGLDNGFMIFDSSSEKSESGDTKLSLKLVNATCYNEKGQIIDLNILNFFSFEIPFKYRNLVFNFAIPGDLPESYSINYKLDSDEWIHNGISKSVTFNYLPWGNHELKMRAVDESLNVLSELSYNVKVLPPWYLKIYALIVYILIASVIVYFIIVFNRFRLKKQKLAYLKKIKSDNTRSIIRMKNQYLKTEVQNKSAELVNYTVLLRKKNEVLIRVKELLGKLIDLKENLDKKSTKQIYNIIDQNLSDKNDWKIFSAHFDGAHSKFLKKIKKDHPLLTPNDLQLCAFLKMNLSSKEIAALLNISSRSVEVKRYRLRKKLNLEHDDNLIEFLMDV